MGFIQRSFSVDRNCKPTDVQIGTVTAFIFQLWSPLPLLRVYLTRGPVLTGHIPHIVSRTLHSPTAISPCTLLSLFLCPQGANGNWVQVCIGTKHPLDCFCCFSDTETVNLFWTRQCCFNKGCFTPHATAILLCTFYNSMHKQKYILLPILNLNYHKLKKKKKTVIRSAHWELFSLIYIRKETVCT